ncbi:MAG: efflux RND transporter periplasmic adaptor subunit [Chlorobi bacterium]|nr:efflux RND transporter periplasmic adaptor subunit [Chlorobiota bacterium]
MNSKKILKYLVITVVVLLVFAVIGKKKGWFGKGIVYKVSIENPKNRDIIETITANGKIQPETEVKISPDVSGEIVELNVKEGDEVKKDDLILKIKPDIYLSAVERARAALNSTKANLANAKAQLLQAKAQLKKSELDYNRNKKLWEEKTISDAEFENIESTFETAKANVEAGQQSVNSAMYSVKSAEASLKESRENLTKTTIYSPINGTVSRLNVESGERVVGTMQMAGTEMLRIADLNKMEVKVDVNENDIVRVKLGDTTIINIDAYINKNFKGIVTEIANSANTAGVSTDQVTSFDVKIRILFDSYKELIKDNNSKYPFRPGMSATVDIQTNAAKNVLSIPLQAVTVRIDSAFNKEKSSTSSQSNNTDEVVFTIKDDFAFIQKVKTGIQDNNFIQITDGLDYEDQVVVAPYSAISKKLKDSVAVEIVDEKELFKSEKKGK